MTEVIGKLPAGEYRRGDTFVLDGDTFKREVEMKVTVWKKEDGSWCYQIEGQPEVFVYGTKRSVLNAVERALDKAYGIAKE